MRILDQSSAIVIALVGHLHRMARVEGIRLVACLRLTYYGKLLMILWKRAFCIVDVVMGIKWTSHATLICFRCFDHLVFRMLHMPMLCHF